MECMNVSAGTFLELLRVLTPLCHIDAVSMSNTIQCGFQNGDTE